MNIFLLHLCPGEAARAHCDTHVVSQIRESCQMLSTAHRVLNGQPGLVIRDKPGRNGRRDESRPILRELGERDGMHRKDAKIYWDCYVNHPCNVWLRQSADNYMFLWDLMVALNRQFIHRYGRGSHASWLKHALPIGQPPRGLMATGVTPFPQVMPEAYRGECPVEAYRRYYVGEKAHLYFRNGGGPMWKGYAKGIDAPLWLQSSTTSIGIKRT